MHRQPSELLPPQLAAPPFRISSSAASPQSTEKMGGPLVPVFA